SAPTAGGAAAPSAAASASVAQMTGSIGRYTICQQLGAGSFGVVLRCSDDDLKRDVAIKLPHRQGAPSAERVKEFLHEAQSAARLRHPGIVTVLDTGQTADGRVYIVYEFIRGATLQSRLEQGNYSLEDVVRWMAGSAEALHHAHKNGIVHRDIKPANILLDEESNPHVADFGLAKMDDQFFKNDAGRVLGTAAYMSPEQAAGQSHWASPQTDIYSLGVMLYQMLTKRLPFGGRTLSEMLEQVKQRVPSPPRTIDDKIPKPLEDVCLKAMAKNPANRYSTAADMAADLRRAIGGAPPASRGRWIIGGLGGAAAAALIAVLIISANSRRDDGPSRTGIPNVVGPSNLIRPAAGLSLDPTIPFEPTTPKLEVHYQAAGEKGAWHILDRRSVLHAGDRVQMHVTLEVPRYVYMYWYDAEGKPTRLWPEAPANQQKVAKVDSPKKRDEWHKVDEQLGAEFLLVAARDKPLIDDELDRFEKQLAYSKNEIRLDGVFPVGSKDVSRGLAGIVQSRKNPLDSGFESLLEQTFSAYHGLVIP
ncbi:MAG TPA: protein kinase, partial [Pirellulales bacterium]